LPTGFEDNLDEFRSRLGQLRRELSPPAAPGAFVANTDGACIGNPGPGGWGTLVEGADQHRWELSGHLARTTNNRAEALAVLAALEWVPAGSQLRLHSDSELTVRQLEGKYKVKKNTDIWLEIQRVRAEKPLTLQIEWVRGHGGDPGNEHADWLSRLGAANGDAELAARLGRAAPAADKLPPELVGLAPRAGRETEFVQSVARQLRSGRSLSPKQRAWLDSIRARGR
jgi:ribonuclease HI